MTQVYHVKIEIKTNIVFKKNTPRDNTNVQVYLPHEDIFSRIEHAVIGFSHSKNMVKSILLSLFKTLYLLLRFFQFTQCSATKQKNIFSRFEDFSNLLNVSKQNQKERFNIIVMINNMKVNRV